MRIQYLALAVGVVLVAACSEPDRPDLNSPTVSSASTITSQAQVGPLAIGMLSNDRASNETEILFGETIAHDALNITGSEPRFITELVGGSPIVPSDFIGSSLFPYGTIRLANISIHGISAAQSSVLSDAQKAGALGFFQTMKALEYLRVIETRDTLGAPINVDISPTGPPAPLSCKPDVLRYIVALLDSAAANLSSSGATFPFGMPDGFAGFNQPSTFLLFNRAIAAKANIYLGFRNGPSAPDVAALNAAAADLAASFMDTTTGAAGLNAGPMHTYSLSSGDATNGLVSPTTERANPDIVLESGGFVGKTQTPADPRLAAIIDTASLLSIDGISSNLQYTLYPTPTSSVPIITNKELIFDDAEVKVGLGNLPGAMADVNLIRTDAGLPPYGVVTSADSVITDILYEKRIELAWQSADRWFDLRMFGRLNTNPPPAGLGPGINGAAPVWNFPFPQAELNARSNLNKQCTAP